MPDTVLAWAVRVEVNMSLHVDPTRPAPIERGIHYYYAQLHFLFETLLTDYITGGKEVLWYPLKHGVGISLR